MKRDKMATRGPERKVSDRELLQCFQNATKPILTAGEIAEIVGLSNTRVHQRMKQLMEIGKIEKKKVGNGVVYWTVQEDSEST